MTVLAIVARILPQKDRHQIFVIVYKEGRGVMRQALARSTGLGYHASLTKTNKSETPGKATRVQASMLFRGGKGAVEDLIESLSEIKGMISVQVTTDEND